MTWKILFGLTEVILVLQIATVGHSQHPQMDPTKTVGIESCAECHEEIVDRWAESTHATSFTNLLKSEKASEIAEVVGIQVGKISETASCVRCHYTREFRHSAPQTTESVSCESCHGPALDWIDIHNLKSLSRTDRIEKATEAGMRHSGNIYEVSKSCFECHVIDDEQLVNHTVHPAVSDGFELLSWYAGETSHNFLIQVPGRNLKKHSSDLQPIPIERKRMLFLTGKLLHLSYSLKVISRSSDAPVDTNGKFILLKTGRPTFAVQHAIQAREVAGELEKLQALVKVDELEKAVSEYRKLTFKTGQNAAIGKAADEIDRLAKLFTENHNGSELGQIDPVLEKLIPRFPGNKPQSTLQLLTELGLDSHDVKKVNEMVDEIRLAE